MRRDGMDHMDLLLKQCEPALAAACSRLARSADHAAPELRQYRNVYDGNGEYEFPIATHYVPRYLRS
jgi:hypothetical protein